MALTARTITVQLKANRPPVPGEYWAWQANKLTVDITLPDGETFDGAESLYCELHSVEFPVDDPPLANVVIASPSGDNAVFEFTGAQMNQTLTAKEGVFWLVVFSNTDDEAPEVVWGSKLKLKAHHASLTTPAPPEPTLALTQTTGDARYRRLSVDIAQSSITGLVAALAGKAPLESPSFTYGISVSDGISTDDLTATGLVNAGSLQVNENIVFAAGSNFAFGTTTERDGMRSALALGSMAYLTAPVGTVLGSSDTQTVSNKSFVDASTFICDDADPTKKAQFQCASITTGTTRTYTLPDATCTLVGQGTALGTPSSGSLGSCTGYLTSALSGTITNAQLAGSIAASKLVGTDITTVGTLVAGAVPTTLLTGTITNAQLAGGIDLAAKVGASILPVANGGTNASTAAGAATSLGLGIGDSPEWLPMGIALATTGTNSTVNHATYKVPTSTGSTNVSIGIQPKGTGAFILGPPPDGTATGGNARGTNAVDLQITRANATGVASGARSFLAGYNNTASGAGCSVLGEAHLVSSSYGFAVGYSHTVSGLAAAAINNANSATAASGFASGKNSLANRLAMQATANGTFSATGDAQAGKCIMRRATSDATQTELTLDGATPTGTTVTTSNRFIIQTSSVCTVDVYVAACSTSSGNRAAYHRRATIYKNATNCALTGLQTIGTDQESDAAWDVTLAADDTNKSLQILVTGAAGVNIRWVARVEFNELISP